jgi:hypothetical protein
MLSLLQGPISKLTGSPTFRCQFFLVPGTPVGALVLLLVLRLVYRNSAMVIAATPFAVCFPVGHMPRGR